MCGREFVPIARRVLSVGQSANADGVKDTQAFDVGARFWWPSSRGSESMV